MMHKLRMIAASTLCIVLTLPFIARANSQPATSKSAANTTIGGCKVFPDNNPWNTDISNAPVDSNSSNYISYINGGGLHFLHPDFGSDPMYGIPFVTVPGTQPKVPVTFTDYANESDPGPYPIPPNTLVEPGDGHVLVIDTGHCILYEMGNAQYIGGPSNAWTASGGAVYNLNSNALRPAGWTSADAAGLPIFPGLARCAEANSGTITHALRFTVRATAPRYIYPARHQASLTSDPNAPPMGLRLRLKANYNLSGITGQALAVAHALQKYGMIVADNGSDWYISGETNPSCWNDTSLDVLKGVPGSAFDVISTVSEVNAVGVFRPSSTAFYLRNTNTTGGADIATALGASTDLPVSGDWDGDGIDSVGVYRPSTGQFFLTNSNTFGAPIAYSFALGSPGDQPIAGDWNSNGKDGVGVFRPSNGLLYLKNILTTGFADFQMVLGSPGDVGVAGDWDGDGIDSPGVYRPANASFYLSNKVCNCSTIADFQAALGFSGDTPFTGDWTGIGRTGIGVFRPSNGLIYLKNIPVSGFADKTIVFGIPNDKPVAGHWSMQTTDPKQQMLSKYAPTFVP
ncbi:MAG: hypothetical protein ABI947_02060 [Chloroflexota bacterium]